MRHQFLLLLFFSQVMFAQAAEHGSTLIHKNEAIPFAQNDGIAAAEIEQRFDSGEAPLDVVYSADAHRIYFPSDTPSTFEEFVSAMPQPAVNADYARKTEEPEHKKALDRAVLKLASMPKMRSAIVLIYDENGQQALHSKNADVVAPIASITKLMTAMVVLDAKLPLDEEISISQEDINRQKRTRSRTRTGMTMTRGELLKLALMASDNLSAAALARTYPGGTKAALAQMNAKARNLGMHSARFTDPTGLSSGNVSTANDLVKMVRAAKDYELINRFSTSTSHTIELVGQRPVRFHNTNPLVRNASWDIGLSKTGFISEAGRCLVMEAKIAEYPVIIVLLDSWGRNSRVGDANRVKKWMETASVRGQKSKSM